VMGLYVNNFRSAISPAVLHFLHEFYEMVAFFLNTIIFLIAGCKLGALIVDSSTHDLYVVGTGSFGMIVAIYPIILFARGAAILVAFPLIKRLGTGCTWQEAVVMWWGGLRGSVGLALALAVHHTIYDEGMWGNGASNTWGAQTLLVPTLNCRDQPLMVLTLILYVVLLTVVINGITMAPLMRFLKLTKIPEDRQFMLQRAKLKIDAETKKSLARMRDQYSEDLPDVDWESPDIAVGAPLAHAAKCTGTMIEQIDRDTWLLVLNLERAYYMAQFEAGRLGDQAQRLLEGTMADICAHAALVETSKLGEVYDQHFDKLLVKMRKMKPSHAYEAGLAYIGVQHESDHLTHHDADNTDGDELSEKIRDARLKVKEEHTDNIAKIKQALIDLRAKAPKSVKAFQTRFVATQLLRNQRKLVEHMKHEGELLDLDSAPLIDEIDAALELRLVGKNAIKAGNMYAVAEQATSVVATTAGVVGAKAIDDEEMTL